MIRLDDAHSLETRDLPKDLAPDFEALWALHPDDYHEIKLHGRLVKTPRWQQAYGADYHYTGRVNKALPVPPLLEALHAWARTIDARLNGILLNWYDAGHEHYIGPHRDSTIGMIEGCPIVTISFGSERVFRLKPWKPKGERAARVDVPVVDRTVLIMRYETNLAWTHEVPHRARDQGRRISVTLRGFTS